MAKRKTNAIVIVTKVFKDVTKHCVLTSRSRARQILLISMSLFE